MLLVFGSINLDLAFRTARLPAPGETVLGTGYTISPGGKGANQAHAAGLFGVETALFGAVGADDFAEPALIQLERAGVDLRGVQRLTGQTGCAAISVDDAGQNQIVVAPGVNLAVTQATISEEDLARARGVLVQMETVPAENWALVRRAKARGCRTFLNNAPAGPVPLDVLAALDVLVVNEVELVQTARAVALPELDPERTVRALSDQFALTVVLTLGEDGSLYCAGGEVVRKPAAKVTVVDTTGAGDTFTGVLAAALIEDRSLDDAIELATVAASLACMRAGAQIAQPTRREINAALPAYRRAVADGVRHNA